MTSTTIVEFTLSIEDATYSTIGVTSVTGGSGGDSGTGTGVHPPWVWYYPWTWAQILQLLIACVGLVGNLLVILVLLRQKAYKHTMDIFIGALALADFVASVFTIPLPKAVKAPDTALGRAYCKWVLTSNSLYIALTASIYTLVGITLERFIAVVFPFHLTRVITKRRVYIYLVGVWVFAVISATGVLTVEVKNNQCMGTLSPNNYTIFTVYLAVLRVIVPSVIMITAQAFTARELHRQSTAMQDARSAGGKGNDQAQTTSFHITARNRVVKLMFIVMLVSLLSVAPHNIAVTVIAVRGGIREYLGSLLHDVLTLLAFINFCANPLIYAARYPRFRSAIKKMLTSRGGDRETSVFGQESSPAETMVSTVSKGP